MGTVSAARGRSTGPGQGGADSAWRGAWALLLLAGCGGASSHAAIEFAEQRITQLQQRTVEQGEDGKWYASGLEIRYAKPGSFTSLWGPTESRVVYEHRPVKAGPFETAEEAEAARLRGGEGEWIRTTEIYTFRDGQWQRKSSQTGD